jgi:hypothetical protein
LTDGTCSFHIIAAKWSSSSWGVISSYTVSSALARERVQSIILKM